jgi:glycosyltransferase involved in cell wall biosynthesis
MLISVIVPAFNEEQYLPATLAAIRAASVGVPCELIVVDNGSSDSTPEIADRHGAIVVAERIHNIGRVRNAGARVATGDVLVFIDADTVVPPTLLAHIGEVMRLEELLGGAVAVAYTEFRRPLMKWYVKGWGFWSRFFNMKQGATQFCRKDAFRQIGGYDETIYVGEDVEFYWRLSRHARRVRGALRFVTDPKVVSSSRRFDKMSVWRVLLFTQPIVFWCNWRRATLWRDWYDRPVR